MTDWFARPIFSVTDVEASLRFYVDRLGFTTSWRFDEAGKAYVAQVDRQGCAIILSNHVYIATESLEYGHTADFPG